MSVPDVCVCVSATVCYASKSLEQRVAIRCDSRGQRNPFEIFKIYVPNPGLQEPYLWKVRTDWKYEYLSNVLLIFV